MTPRVVAAHRDRGAPHAGQRELIGGQQIQRVIKSAKPLLGAHVDLLSSRDITRAVTGECFPCRYVLLAGSQLFLKPVSGSIDEVVWRHILDRRVKRCLDSELMSEFLLLALLVWFVWVLVSLEKSRWQLELIRMQQEKTNQLLTRAVSLLAKPPPIPPPMAGLVGDEENVGGGYDGT